MKIFLLVDCNNFFVSCERIFNPKLRNVPVVVLSNNDGCIVARSNEAKRLGFKMGEPIFECKELVDFWDVKVFSSNFELYNNISSRVMSILKEYTPHIEIYSVDEAFLEIGDIEIFDYFDFGKEIKEKIYKWVGVPVSVGIARTKTLAKVAGKIAKKGDGVCSLLDRDITGVLKDFPVGDVWGIGFRSTSKLNSLGIYSALDFVEMESKWVKKNMSICGIRVQNELKGESCIDIQKDIETHKSVAYTRSFSTAIYEYASLRKRIVDFACGASHNLRRQMGNCKCVTVFISGNRHREGYYKNGINIKLDEYSDNTIDIIKAATKGLDRIFLEGEGYKKAGVVLSDIKRSEDIPYSLFPKDMKKSVDRCIDDVNMNFPQKMKIASCSITHQESRGKLSKRYTTNWNQLMVVK